MSTDHPHHQSLPRTTGGPPDAGYAFASILDTFSLRLPPEDTELRVELRRCCHVLLRLPPPDQPTERPFDSI